MANLEPTKYTLLFPFFVCLCFFVVVALASHEIITLNSMEFHSDPFIRLRVYVRTYTIFRQLEGIPIVSELTAFPIAFPL